MIPKRHDTVEKRTHKQISTTCAKVGEVNTSGDVIREDEVATFKPVT